MPGLATLIGWILFRADAVVLVALGLAAVWAIAVASAESVSIRYRSTHTNHATIPGLAEALRRERRLLYVFWTGAALQTIVGLAPFMIAWPSALAYRLGLCALLAAAAVIQLVPWIAQPIVQRRIKRIVGRNTRTSEVAKTRIWHDETGGIGGDELGEVLVDAGTESSFWLHRYASRVLSSRVGVSAYVVAIWCSVSGILAIDAAAMVREGVRPIHTGRPAQSAVQKHRSHGPTREHTGHHPRGGTGQTSSESTTAAGGTTSTLRSTSSSAATWESTCGPDPGFDAPSWARSSLYKLYLGVGGPGAKAGCTPRTYRQPQFAYTVGYEDGKVKSVAVVSEGAGAYPPALFLAPAARLVLQLISSGAGPLGGSPRLDALVGDLYLVYTREGTVVLARSSKNGQYAVIPATVADEWYADMTVRSEWLWPVRDADDPRTGYERFTFLGPDNQLTGLAVSFDPHDGTALIPTTAGTVFHRPQGSRITVSELEKLGATIDPMLSDEMFPAAIYG